jgi:hypothetical protein
VKRNEFWERHGFKVIAIVVAIFVTLISVGIARACVDACV